MVEFLIDNIYVGFGGHVYQQIVGISMSTNCRKLTLMTLLMLQNGLKNPKRCNLAPLLLRLENSTLLDST